MGPASQTATVTTRPVPPPPPPIPSSPPVSAAPAAPMRSTPKSDGSSTSNSSKTDLLLGLVAVMFLAVAAAGGWWWWSNRHQAAAPPVAQTPASENTPAPAAPAEIPPLAPVPAEPATSSLANILNNASILDLVQANTPTADIVKKIRSSKTGLQPLQGRNIPAQTGRCSCDRDPGHAQSRWRARFANWFHSSG